MGTDSNVYIKIIGTKKRHTGKQFLELLQKKAFLPGSVETFSVEAVDVGEVKQIEVSSSVYNVFIHLQSRDIFCSFSSCISSCFELFMLYTFGI